MEAMLANIHGTPERCDGLLKTDKRIKEKTVVPVVHGGKVGNLPM
jgi:hypothetical protein